MMNTNPAYYSNAEIEGIASRISVIDYFLHLENQGKVHFEKTTGHDYYFRTSDNKFSVSEKGYYDFKTAEGGHIIKAVMELEKLEWKDAVDFLKNFNPPLAQQVGFGGKKIFPSGGKDKVLSEAAITNSFVPNNNDLISYFEKRGISKDVLIENTRQYHYEVGGKKYFGIGIENLSHGIEIRNPMMKSKIGKTDISELKGSRNEIILFEGMTDMLSFLQLLKDNNQTNSRTLVTLNSTANVEKFLVRYKDFNGKIFLCLDGDEAGTLATQRILNQFKGKNIKDIRSMYQISDKANNDLNDYLKNKILLQNKNSKLVTPKTAENETTGIKSNRISETQQVEPKSLDQNPEKCGQNFQSGKK